MMIKTNLLVSCFTIIFAACGTQSTSNNQTQGESCNQMVLASTDVAFQELELMSSLVAIGSKCSLKRRDTSFAYDLILTGLEPLSFSIPANLDNRESPILASRQTCNGVPYWRTESAVVSNDGFGELNWVVREDTKETSQFSFVKAEDQIVVSLKDCE